MSTRKPVVLPALNAKFVLIRYNIGSKEEYFIRGDDIYGSHSFAFGQFNDEIKKTGKLASSCGGGFVYIDPKKKIVRLEGSSGLLGPVRSKKIVQSLFKHAYPEYTIINALE